jgi:hypothetical protein
MTSHEDFMFSKYFKCDRTRFDNVMQWYADSILSKVTGFSFPGFEFISWELLFQTDPIASGSISLTSNTFHIKEPIVEGVLLKFAKHRDIKSVFWAAGANTFYQSREEWLASGATIDYLTVKGLIESVESLYEQDRTLSQQRISIAQLAAHQVDMMGIQEYSAAFRYFIDKCSQRVNSRVTAPDQAVKELVNEYKRARAAGEV